MTYLGLMRTRSRAKKKINRRISERAIPHLPQFLLTAHAPHLTGFSVGSLGSLDSVTKKNLRITRFFASLPCFLTYLGNKRLKP